MTPWWARQVWLLPEAAASSTLQKAQYVGRPLFFELAFLRRIGRAFELDAVTVGIGQGHYPKTVSDKWAFARLNST